MNLINGMNRRVAFSRDVIRREASQEGQSSIVTANLQDREISISQHSSGSWDISVNEEPVEEFSEEEANQAVEKFMEMCRS